jgi:hypothetical protein
MNAGFSGADVQELRALATTFQDASDRLLRGRMSVGSQIQISAWVGPFASRFRMAWESEHSARVAGVARELARNATILRTNADEQAAASAADSASWTAAPQGMGELSPYWHDVVVGAKNIAGLVGLGIDWAKVDLVGLGLPLPDLAKGLRELDGTDGALRTFGRIGKGLMIVGALFDASDVVSGLASGNWGDVMHGGIGLGLSGLGLFPPALPFVIAAGAVWTAADLAYTYSPGFRQFADATAKAADSLGDTVAKAAVETGHHVADVAVDVARDAVESTERVVEGIAGPLVKFFSF